MNINEYNINEKILSNTDFRFLFLGFLRVVSTPRMLVEEQENGCRQKPVLLQLDWDSGFEMLCQKKEKNVLHFKKYSTYNIAACYSQYWFPTGCRFFVLFFHSKVARFAPLCTSPELGRCHGWSTQHVIGEQNNAQLFLFLWTCFFLFLLQCNFSHTVYCCTYYTYLVHDLIVPHITVGFLFSSLHPARRPSRPPRPRPRPVRASVISSHNYSSHTTHLTQLISHNSSHTQLISRNSSHTIHLTQFISHTTHLTNNSSHTTHLTQLISHNSFHTQLISHNSSHTQLISHTTHPTHNSSHTTHLSHNSSHTQLISHNSSHTPHLTDVLLGRRSTQSFLKELRRD